MSERWVDIPDFPDYEISDHGKVFSKRLGCELALSQNMNGIVKVGLHNRGQTTKAVRVLVAEAFVPKPEDPFEIGKQNFPNVHFVDDSRTGRLDVINIDGNQENLHYTNLAWRPHWYAWKYTRQFNTEIPDYYYVGVINTDTAEVYADIMSAGIADAVLWELVYHSAISGRPVFPTGAIYEFLDQGTVSSLKQVL